MAYPDIAQLVEKYWQGETDLSEEQVLKEYFRANKSNLPDELKETASLFAYYDEETWQHAPLDNFSVTGKRRIPRKKYFPVLNPYWEYAALLLLLLGSIWLFYASPAKHPARPEIQDTYDDPREAMIATQKALEILANNLNKGKAEMSKLSLFDEAQRKVMKQ